MSTEKPDWNKIVMDIMNTPNDNYTYERIGKEIGDDNFPPVSRSFVGRLVSNKNANPPFSYGYNLMQLRNRVMKKSTQQSHGRRRNQTP